MHYGEKFMLAVVRYIRSKYTLLSHFMIYWYHILKYNPMKLSSNLSLHVKKAPTNYKFNLNNLNCVEKDPTLSTDWSLEYPTITVCLYIINCQILYSPIMLDLKLKIICNFRWFDFIIGIFYTYYCMNSITNWYFT